MEKDKCFYFKIPVKEFIIILFVLLCQPIVVLLVSNRTFTRLACFPKELFFRQLNQFPHETNSAATKLRILKLNNFPAIFISFIMYGNITFCRLYARRFI